MVESIDPNPFVCIGSKLKACFFQIEVASLVTPFSNQNLPVLAKGNNPTISRNQYLGLDLVSESNRKVHSKSFDLKFLGP